MDKFCGRDFCLPLGEKTYVMGILNVTPDSFSDGGRYASAESAAKHALEMRDAGADIIDVGACSTAPGSVPVTGEEERRRLLPVLRALSGLGVPVSVDTYDPETAAAALESGAAIINDVSGALNPAMAAVIAKHNAGWIITHGGSADAEPDGQTPVLKRIGDFFRAALRFADACGIPRESICLDPGVGFGKTRAEDLTVLRETALCKAYAGGCALLAGASRKRVIGEATGESDPQKRDPGTAAAHTIAIAGGADIIRVHDVRGAVQAAKTADAICRADKTPTEKRSPPAKHGSPDKLVIRDLKVFAYHGVNAEEKEHGQTFALDLDITAESGRACLTDDLNDTVSYAKIMKSVTRSMTAQAFDLIERAAQQVTNDLLAEYPSIQEIRLLLKKPDAPVKADFGYAGIEITRTRKKTASANEVIQEGMEHINE